MSRNDNIRIGCVLVVIGAIACSLSSSIIPPSISSLTIELNNYVGNEPLKLDSGIYTTALGQTYTVSKFKYYLSNIHLKAADGSDYAINDYYLVDEENDKSKQISLRNIPPGTYTSLVFTIGVDSVHNCSGAQSGALDPINGMFWAWNTGYIFLKIEGHASASKSPGHIFEFHIGGYKAMSNCIRKIELNLVNSPLQLEPGKASKLQLKANASYIFGSPGSIDFGIISSVTDFHHATEIADNYAGMFSVQKVKP